MPHAAIPLLMVTECRESVRMIAPDPPQSINVRLCRNQRVVENR